MNVGIKFDRIGDTYYAGETVTGVCHIENPSPTSHNGIVLDVNAEVKLQSSQRGLASFDPLYNSLKPVKMMSLSMQLSKKGERLPSGDIEIPFSFLIAPTKDADGSLVETYNGVFISSSYTATVTIAQSLKKITSTPRHFLVICRGQCSYLVDQSSTEEKELHEFLIDDSKVIGSSRSLTPPNFRITGAISLINDLDVPLSGWVKIDHCAIKIASIELQLIRVESAVILGLEAREATEIENIQIGEGDVLQNLEIPIYVFFPRWFTCPSIRTTHIRVDFECNFVVSLEDKTQISYNFPLLLHRALD